MSIEERREAEKQVKKKIIEARREAESSQLGLSLSLMGGLWYVIYGLFIIFLSLYLRWLHLVPFGLLIVLPGIVAIIGV